MKIMTLIKRAPIWGGYISVPSFLVKCTNNALGILSIERKEDARKTINAAVKVVGVTTMGHPQLLTMVVALSFKDSTILQHDLVKAPVLPGWKSIVPLPSLGRKRSRSRRNLPTSWGRQSASAVRCPAKNNSTGSIYSSMSGTDGVWALEAGAGGDDELGAVGEVVSCLATAARVLFDSLFSHESGEWLSCNSGEDFVRVVLERRSDWNLRHDWRAGRWVI